MYFTDRARPFLSRRTCPPCPYPPRPPWRSGAGHRRRGRTGGARAWACSAWCCGEARRRSRRWPPPSRAGRRAWRCTCPKGRRRASGRRSAAGCRRCCAAPPGLRRRRSTVSRWRGSGATSPSAPRPSSQRRRRASAAPG
eukprot:scaffold82493_cov69-Phaeocystis_antarctica.AAC.3